MMEGDSTNTFTGNRGLRLEEPLIFEQDAPGRSGVDLPESQPVQSRLGGKVPSDCPGCRNRRWCVTTPGSARRTMRLMPGFIRSARAR